MGDEYLPFIPDKYQKGFLLQVLYSVTVEINRQIGMLKRQKKKPARIRLGPICSIRFCYEQTGFIDMRRAPKVHLGMPVYYHQRYMEGVVVEGEDKP